MAISFDAAGPSATELSAAPVVMPHTCAGEGRAVIAVGVAMRVTGSPSITALSATYDGQPMTLLDEIVITSGYAQRCGIFGILNPPAGTKNISFSHTGSGGTTIGSVVNALSYNGVASFGGAAKQSGTGTSASMTVSSAPGEVVSQAFIAMEGSTGYSQTLRANAPTNWYMGDAPGAGSVNFTLGMPANIAWHGLAARLVPLPGLPVKVHLGGAWVQKQMKRWNGTAWVEVNPKVWDGSDWT